MNTPLPNTTDLLVNHPASSCREEIITFTGVLHHAASRLFVAAVKTLQHSSAHGQRSSGKADWRPSISRVQAEGCNQWGNIPAAKLYPSGRWHRSQKAADLLLTPPHPQKVSGGFAQHKSIPL